MVRSEITQGLGDKHSWADIECHFHVLRRSWLKLKHVRHKRWKRCHEIVSRRVAATAISMFRRHGWNVNEQEVEDILQSWQVQLLDNGFQRSDERPIHRLAFVILQRLINKRLPKYAREAGRMPESFDVPDSCDGPQRSAIRNEIVRRVRREIGLLGSKNQDAVSHRLESEDSETMEGNVSASAWYSRIHRAKRHLRIALSDLSDLDW